MPIRTFLFVLIIVLCNKAGFTQDFSYKEGKIFYQYIDTIPGSKGQLFEKAKTFLSLHYKDHIAHEAKDSSRLFAKPVLEIEEFSGPFKGKHPISYTLDIQFNDNNVVFQMYDLLYDTKHELETVKTIRYKDKTKIKGFNDVIKQTNVQLSYLHKQLIATLIKN